MYGEKKNSPEQFNRFDVNVTIVFNRVIRFKSHYGNRCKYQMFAMKTRGIIALPILFPIQKLDMLVHKYCCVQNFTEISFFEIRNTLKNKNLYHPFSLFKFNLQNNKGFDKFHIIS